METKRDTRPEIRSTFIDVQEGAVNMPYQYDNKEFSSFFIEDDREKSITEICKDNDKNYGLVQDRLKYGYNMKDALNTPKKVTKQGSPVVVDGILYNSLAAAIRKYNLEEKEQKIRLRIRKGRDPTEVFQEMQLR